jgi:hypothetical protein
MVATGMRVPVGAIGAAGVTPDEATPRTGRRRPAGRSKPHRSNRRSPIVSMSLRGRRALVTGASGGSRLSDPIHWSTLDVMSQVSHSQNTVSPVKRRVPRGRAQRPGRGCGRVCSRLKGVIADPEGEVAHRSAVRVADRRGDRAARPCACRDPRGDLHRGRHRRPRDAGHPPGHGQGGRPVLRRRDHRDRGDPAGRAIDQKGNSEPRKISRKDSRCPPARRHGTCHSRGRGTDPGQVRPAGTDGAPGAGLGPMPRSQS